MIEDTLKDRLAPFTEESLKAALEAEGVIINVSISDYVYDPFFIPFLKYMATPSPTPTPDTHP